MQFILVKLTLYFTEKCQKPKFSLFFFLAKPYLILEHALKKSNTFDSASTAGHCTNIIGLLLRVYNNVQAEW